jgi:hypothetical protein
MTISFKLRSEISGLMVTSMKLTAFRDAAPCSLVEVNLHSVHSTVAQKAFAFKYASLAMVAMELNGIHQLLVYADDVNLLGKNINISNGNMVARFDTSKEGGLEVYVQKTYYIFMSHHQTMRRFQ